MADVVLAKEIQAAESKAPAKEPATKAAATTVALTPEQLAPFVGLYWNQEDDAFVKIRVKDGKLDADNGGDELLVLKPFAESRFHIADKPWGDQVEIHFVQASGDKPRRMEQSFAGGKPTLFEAAEGVTPAASELAPYAGAYVSEEIDPVYRIVVDGDKMSLTRLKHKPDTLRPTVRDVFSGDIGTVRFVRDANGGISGFVLNAGRIQNFHFSKKAN